MIGEQELYQFISLAQNKEIPLFVRCFYDAVGDYPDTFISFLQKLKDDGMLIFETKERNREYAAANYQSLRQYFDDSSLSLDSSSVGAFSRDLEHRDIQSPDTIIDHLGEDDYLLSDFDDEYWDEWQEYGEPPNIEGYQCVGMTIQEVPVYRLPELEPTLREDPVEISEEYYPEDDDYSTMVEGKFDATPKKYAHIDFTPPEGARKAAERGLEIRKQQPRSQRGGLTNAEASKEGIGSGVQRAVNLKNGSPLSPKVVKQMKAFFDRHSAFKHKHSEEPEGKARQSWLQWGGDAGYSWAKKVVAQMEAADKKERQDAIARFNKKYNDSLTEEALLDDIRNDSQSPTYEWVTGYNRGDSWVPGYVRYYRDRTLTEGRVDAGREGLKKEVIINKLGDRQSVWKKRGVRKVSCPSGRCTNESAKALGAIVKTIEGVEQNIKTGTGVLQALRESGKSVKPIEIDNKTSFSLGEFIQSHPEGRYYLFNDNHAMALIDGELIDTDPKGAIADKGWRRRVSAFQVIDKTEESKKKDLTRSDAEKGDDPLLPAVKASIERTQPVIDQWLKTLKKEIQRLGSYEAVLEKLPDLAKKLPLDDLGQIFQEGNIVSHLIGLSEDASIE